MNRTTVASVLFAAAFAPGQVNGIELVPREGLVLQKEFRSVRESEFSSGSASFSSTSAVTVERTLVVTDLVREVHGSRVARLEREYDEVHGETTSASKAFGGGSFTMSSTESSPVEEATVRFDWDAQEQAYRASCEELSEEVVGLLDFDYDFLALLPGREVAPGDSWTLDADAYCAMTDPWESLSLDKDVSFGGGGGGNIGALETDAEDVSREGEVVCRFAETREVDGVKVAAIELEGTVEVTTEKELSADSFSLSQVRKEVGTIQGEALWNLAGGHLHTLELEVEFSSRGDTAMSGVDLESESEDQESGTTTFHARFAPPKSD